MGNVNCQFYLLMLKLVACGHEKQFSRYFNCDTYHLKGKYTSIWNFYTLLYNFWLWLYYFWNSLLFIIPAMLCRSIFGSFKAGYPSEIRRFVYWKFYNAPKYLQFAWKSSIFSPEIKKNNINISYKTYIQLRNNFAVIYLMC